MKKERFQLIKKIFKEYSDAECTILASSLSYYTVFSLAPMLIVIISVASLFVGRDAITGVLFKEINGLVGADAAGTLQTMMAHSYHPKANILATVLGVITLLFGAIGVFSQMQHCLNKIWNVKPKPVHEKKKKLLKEVKDRFLSFGMLMAIIFLLLVSLTVSAALTAFWGYISNFVPEFSVILLKLAEILISLSLMAVLFSLMFKFLPDIKIGFRDVWKGGVVTAFFFEIGKNIIALYLGKTNVASSYGGAGAIAVIMLWVYYTTLILFFGACFTKAYAGLHGHHVKPEEYSELRTGEGVRPKTLEHVHSASR